MGTMQTQGISEAAGYTHPVQVCYTGKVRARIELTRPEGTILLLCKDRLTEYPLSKNIHFSGIIWLEMDQYEHPHVWQRAALVKATLSVC